MIENSNLYGIVVWYYPTVDNIMNINTYIDNVHKLIVVDNTPADNSSLLSNLSHSKIIYIANLENKGIATALNQGCDIASENGAEWVLTMDQDSRFIKDELSDFITLSNKYSDFDKVAIFSPVHFDARNNKEKGVVGNRYSNLKYTITSGNLLCLNKLKIADGFLDKLFIDWVDDEICIRFCKLQFQIVQINSIILEHFVGNGTIKRNFFGKTKYFDDYSPVRYYYITRNFFILCKLYPTEALRLKKRWSRLVRKTILYDNKNKFQKIKFVILGIIDYYSGLTGPLK